VPVAQLTPTPTLAISSPADPGVQIGGGVGGPFNGATTAVLTVPGMPIVGQGCNRRSVAGQALKPR